MPSRVEWKLANDVRVSLSMGNRKTGRMLVSKTSANTCPPGCPFLGSGCYAEFSQSGTQKWREISEIGQSGISWSDFCERVRTLRAGSLWRHNEAGDLPGIGNRIDKIALSQLVMANIDRRGFTYTHKPVLTGPNSVENRKLINGANVSGFTINLSADNIVDADSLHSLRIAPIVVVIPTDAPRRLKTPKGVRILSCPAENSDKTCRDCGWCQKPNRSFVVGFHAHGVRKRMVSEIVG